MLSKAQVFRRAAPRRGRFTTRDFWFNVYRTSRENKPNFDSLRRILDFLGVLLYIKQIANTMLAKASSEAGRRIASGCVLINCVVAKHLENLIFEAQNQNSVLFYLKFFDTINSIGNNRRQGEEKSRFPS